MVRTSGGIRISAGKSSKKGGGGGGSGGSRSTPSTPSGKSSSRSSSRLPPIPHCDAPSWQKPITNFFNTGASSSKLDVSEIEVMEGSPEDNRTKDNTSNEDSNIKEVKNISGSEQKDEMKTASEEGIGEKLGETNGEEKENEESNISH